MSQETANRNQQTGLRLVSRPVQRAVQTAVIREGSTGRVVAVLPQVWAVAETLPGPTHAKKARMNGPMRNHTHDGKAAANGAFDDLAQPCDAEAPKVEVAFYRKYTEAMLRRYLRLSMEAGRVPSLMGREMFRGHVTSYRVRSFEDVVIFCFDMEKCLGKLDRMDQQLIKRIALQQYTQGEAAGMLGLSLRNCIRMYWDALDRLTELLLAAKMLEPLKSCQEDKPCPKKVTSSF